MLSLYLSMVDSKEDKSKFKSIYISYKNLMLNRAFDILKDKGLAEDAVHNAFMRILKNMDKISQINCPKTKSFVVIIVENVAKTMYNKEHKIITVELEDTIPSSEKPETIVENKMEVEIIKKKIDLLPEIYRAVLVLKFYNDLSDKEISKILNISVSAVQKRFYRGRKILLSSMKDGENND